MNVLAVWLTGLQASAQNFFFASTFLAFAVAIDFRFPYCCLLSQGLKTVLYCLSCLDEFCDLPQLRLFDSRFKMNSAHICLIRHGETDWNRLGILQGWMDVPINARGRQQAQQMAAAFYDAGFAAVWSSPLVRARETAEIIAGTLQLPTPNLHEGLKERHFGAIQGIPKEELAEHNPAQLEQILRRNPSAQFVGGESGDEFADRVLAAISEIGGKSSGKRILVVTHGWVLDVMTRHAGGLPRNAVLAAKPKNGDSAWVIVSDAGITQ
jgi:probable phosphoglycerate mutase